MIAPPSTTVRPPPGPPPRKGLAWTRRYHASLALDPVGFVAGRSRAFGALQCLPKRGGRRAGVALSR